MDNNINSYYIFTEDINNTNINALRKRVQFRNLIFGIIASMGIVLAIYSSIISPFGIISILMMTLEIFISIMFIRLVINIIRESHICILINLGHIFIFVGGIIIFGILSILNPPKSVETDLQLLIFFILCISLIVIHIFLYKFCTNICYPDKEIIRRIRNGRIIISSRNSNTNHDNANINTTRSFNTVMNIGEDYLHQDNKIDSNIDMTCVICFSNTRNTVFIPCRHFCACYQCSLRCNKCPICRENIQLMPIYNV